MPDDTLLEAAEQLAKFIAIAAGYKAQCIEAGFSEPVAETMAADMHRLLIGQVMAAKR